MHTDSTQAHSTKTRSTGLANQYDVVIVGGGIIGLTLAAILYQKSPSLKLCLVDASVPAPLDISTIDSRVIALSKENENLYESLNVWDAVKSIRACPYFDMFVWDGEGTADIHFDSRMARQKNLGHIVENKVLVDVLLSSISGVDTRFHSKVSNFYREGAQSVVELDQGESISASVVIGADGANSPLRKIANIPSREWDYGHTAIVATVQVEKDHCNTAWQRFSEQGPLAFLPIDIPGLEQNLCSIVWSIEHEKASELMELSDDAFCQFLGKAFEFKLGEVLRIEKRIAFPLRQRHAKKYTVPGLALVGDAAHTIHPLAGQGANIGLYDVTVLANEIQRAVKREIPLHDPSVLRRYERQRQSHNLLAMSAMEGFKRLFGADDVALRWIRNQGLRFVEQRPWLKHQFLKIANGEK